MRTIDVSEVTKLVRQLCIDANYYLPADLQEKVPREFFINYSKEATLGQELRMVGVRQENEYLMEGLGPEGVCFSARCVF